MSKTKIEEFIYTKDNGEESYRKVVVLRRPQKNYLCLDITELSEEEIDGIMSGIEEAEEHRDKIWEEINVASLWRSFKEEGIEWQDE